MSRGNDGARGKGRGREGSKNSSASRGGNRRNSDSTDRRGKSSPERSTTRGGKNQIVGTSRTGKPVTKKEYINRKKSENLPMK